MGLYGGGVKFACSFARDETKDGFWLGAKKKKRFAQGKNL